MGNRETTTRYMKELRAFLIAKGVSKANVLIVSGRQLRNLFPYADTALCGIIVNEELPAELTHCRDCYPGMATALLYDKLPKPPATMYLEAENEYTLSLVMRGN